MARPLAVTGAGGLRLAGEERGDPGAPPVLFLHGSGQSGGSWGRCAEQLAGSGWRAVTVDLRGHGSSEWAPDGVYTVDDLADDVVAVLDSIGDPAVLVGASMGGWLATVSAARRPAGSVRGVVLVDSAHRGEERGAEGLRRFVDSAARGYASVEEAREALAGIGLDSKEPPDASRLVHALREQDGRYWWHWDPAFADLWTDVALTDHAQLVLDSANSLECPILVIRGENSPLVTAEIVEEFCQQVPGAEPVTLTGVGHMFTGDDNSEFMTAFEPFLERTRDTA